MESRIELIQQAFNGADDHLGTVERNTEIKVVYLMLWELGWHPIREIGSCFQIDKNSVTPPADAALAADYVLRKDEDLCAVGEVKYWKIGSRGSKEWPKAVAQARQYQAALGVPWAFITCGHRWTILDDQGRDAYDFEAKENNVESLLKDLRPVLGRDAIKIKSPLFSSSRLWSYGICPNPSSRHRK